MTRTTRLLGFLAAGLLLLAVAYLALRPGPEPAGRRASPTASLATTGPVPTHPPPARHDGFLYGRITTVDGTTYEGRLRWGGDQEAFWDDTFNGNKYQNPWLESVPSERLPEARPRFNFLGIPLGSERLRAERPFLVHFGDIRTLEVVRGDVRVHLKSGTVWNLDRYSANELDDGVRVWDSRRGVVDLAATVETQLFARDGDRRIRRIELLPTPRLGAVPYRLYGTVRTRHGEFTGFIAWDREDSVGSDELEGETAGGDIGVRYDTIRSIARHSGDGALVTLLDGREIVLTGGPEVGPRWRGLVVVDPRRGRLTIGWDAFERVDFAAAGSGPGYDDFQPGQPLTAVVTTRDGRTLAGRIVYDLDESETTDTLDGDSPGIYYSIPFGRIASVTPLAAGAGGTYRVKVVLLDGEELQLEGTADTGGPESSVLVFTEPGERGEYLRWEEIERIELQPVAALPSPRL